MRAHLPVIIGIGQLTDRSDDLAGKREPLALMGEAARLALRDAGPAVVVDRIESVRVVNSLSAAASPDPAGMLAERTGIGAGERLYTAIGGNGPQWLVNRTADDLAAGRIRAALIAGGEALHTLRLAAKRGVVLPWTRGRGHAATIGDDRQGSHPDEWLYGLQMPTQIYPLFEIALRAYEQRVPAAHAAHLARLSASLSAVAAAHPQAWFRDAKTADEIGTVTPTNRMVAYPYPKFMTSIIDVDQAAAVVMTTVEEADRLGIPAARRVHVHGAGEATDIWHVKDRVDYHSSPGMAEAFRQALAQADVDAGAVALLDLYSCFPAAVQFAARVLGAPTDGSRPLTVTGGLPYFGGAGNDYALHAIATMVERLRSAPDALGLVSALGWYMTKHAVGVYGARAPEREWRRTPSAQAAVDALSRPPFDPAATGRGRVETYTVLHDRDGTASQAIVVVRRDDGTRTLALVDAPEVVATLEREEMVGAPGALVSGADGRNAFRLAGE